MRALLSLLLIACPALAPAKAPVCEPLVIAVEDDAEPWSKRDGTGFANDVVLAAFKAAGVTVTLQVLPYARCRDYVLRGKVAAGFSMSWLPEYKGQLAFSDAPLFVCNEELFFNRTKPLRAVRASDLPQGTVVGVVIGYEYPPEIMALRAKGTLAFEEAESEDLNLKKLKLGRIDAALINTNETKPAGLMLLQAGAVPPAGSPPILVHGFRIGELKSYIGFSLKHP